MTRQGRDAKAAVKDFEDAIKDDLKSLSEEQREHVTGTFRNRFDHGFDHVESHKRHGLGNLTKLRRFIHEAKVQLRNAKGRNPTENPAQYAEEMGEGMGRLLAIVEYGCFRNEWDEQSAENIRGHLLPAIRMLDRAQHDRHHKKLVKQVKRIVSKRSTTPAEQELGAAIIDAFK